jgi:membrane fusion protein, multidrug efflux system
MTGRNRARRQQLILGFALAAQIAAAPVSAEELPPPDGVPVGVAPALSQDLKIYIDAPGTIQAFNTVAIHPQADGQLTEVLFQDGQDVRAGDLLGRIDPRPYKASLDQAIAKRGQDAAQLENAQLDLQRYASLVERDAIARQTADTARYRVAQLDAAVRGDDAAIEAARVQLGFTELRSPVDGQAGIRQIDRGSILHGSGGGSSGGSSQETLVVITQLQPIFAVFSITQRDLPRLVAEYKKGRPPVAVYSKEDNRLIEEGVLEAIDNQLDATTGTIKVKARFLNPDRRLWPGEYVNARVLAETKANAVTVPAKAVQAGPQGPYVFVVTHEGVADARFVTLGTTGDGVAEIAQGLSAGETVVVSGHYRLRPGIKVAVRGLGAAAGEASR